ncbi:ROP-interactive CRIB motif-containing protein 4 [Hibiscus trionum]|uniref:ROP-interactive CRIB motif-containing protein 4 n=1 Tax=Hibiscus trionum TaxID=183268 RepID=A0A9W7HX48_HIBTR|nr:ROP-interactive CRIB motif-containing protein 4 [Hibiscus trionum]
MERFVILPFGCVSESSVAVAVQQQQQPRRSNSKPANARTRHEEEDDDEDEESLSMKPDVTTGFHKLFKGFKTFSQLFVYKEEMEIGLPTDVKHVAHVGLDESEWSSGSRSMGSWDNLFSPRHLFTFPSPQYGPTETQAAVQAST